MTEHELQQALNNAQHQIAALEKDVERFKGYCAVAEKNERLFKEWAAEVTARVLRLYPDALKSLRQDESEERERHWLAGGY